MDALNITAASIQIMPSSVVTNKTTNKVTASAETTSAEDVNRSEVVTQSIDGDTVAVSEVGSQELEDSKAGSVVLTDDNADSTKKETNVFDINGTDQTKKTDEQITFFSGIPNARLEELYQEGRISQEDYDTEIEARQELLAEMTNNQQQSYQATAGLDAVKEDMQQTQQAFMSVNSEEKSDGSDGNDGLSATMKLQQSAVDAQNTQNEAVRSEVQNVWDYQFQA